VLSCSLCDRRLLEKEQGRRSREKKKKKKEKKRQRAWLRPGVCVEKVK
jgi:hypothetical protein